ncbi:DNA polymerase III subunit gamma/tau [Candidatus Saccharibacteria bacterium]|nr:DNA polymerase III subunit gamma/tau [Candidatus Saccharibacteria bacterium]MCB9821499.1 DNA polymerase III subunit gamma/tau [Candidatus Nomurabacteria bacterium]
MGQVLYRKYRSKTLSEVIGQQHITEVLEAALKKNQISHAYLFTGPRGVGKTSIARILAHEINNIEYDESKTYVDIIEIDAASNRRIDEIRELRDKINIVPSLLKYKVYIIDEVHMLTREAFNALLKTLEEPPAHAVFILATTELHKVPETIISRCQRYAFRPISPETAIIQLRKIAKLENIQIDDKSLELIAEHSGGSFRDALSLLDQLASLSDKVTETDTRSVLGVASAHTVSSLIEVMRQGDILTIINNYRDAINRGNDPTVLGLQIAKQLRANLNKSPDTENDLKLLKQLLDLPNSRHPEAELEIILLSQPKSDDTYTQAPQTSDKAGQKKTKKPIIEKSDKKSEITVEPDTSLVNKVIEVTDWQKILDQVKLKRNTLYGILRMAKTKVEAGELTLSFAFPFHVKRIEDANNKSFLENLIHDLGISFGDLHIVHDRNVEPPSTEFSAPEEAKTPAEEPKVPENVMKIFKGAELVNE